MGATRMGGKRIIYEGSYIGLDTKVEYIDQNNRKAKINMKKFVRLAKQCKEKDNKRFFGNWITKIETGKLAIGVVIIDGLNRLANEFGEKAFECIDNS